jgi:hypothetical protein
MARRPAGIMVAVKLDGTLSQMRVIAILRAHARSVVEEARGRMAGRAMDRFRSCGGPHLVWQDNKCSFTQFSSLITPEAS